MRPSMPATSLQNQAVLSYPDEVMDVLSPLDSEPVFNLMRAGPSRSIFKRVIILIRRVITCQPSGHVSIE